MIWCCFPTKLQLFSETQSFDFCNIDLVRPLLGEFLQFQINTHKTSDNHLIHMKGSSLRNENNLDEENALFRKMAPTQHHNRTQLSANTC